MTSFPAMPTPRNHGVALLVSLLMLLTITLLALAGLRDAALQEHMSGNLHARGLAFQAAESALREGEEAVKANPQNYKSSKCIDTDPTDPATWQDGQTALWSWASNKKPRYLIENLGRGPGWGNEAECDGGAEATQYGSRCGELPEACYYRITASPPDDGRAKTQLQIMLRRRLAQ